MAPTLGGGTQDTNFNKGFTEGFFYEISSAKKWGGSGGHRPPYVIMICFVVALFSLVFATCNGLGAPGYDFWS